MLEFIHYTLHYISNNDKRDSNMLSSLKYLSQTQFNSFLYFDKPEIKMYCG